MVKNIKRAAALILVAIICLSFAACHEKGEIAVKVSYDTYSEEFTSGFYACAFFYADNDAQSYLYENLTSDQLYAEDFDYQKQKIEGMKYSEWVKARALEICKELFANKIKCEENNIDTAEYIADANESAEYYWDYYGFSETMPENGVSFETYKKYQQYVYMSEAYFDFLYGEGGEKEIPAADIETVLGEDYAYVNVLTADVTDLEEANLTAKKAEFEAYVERINKGENFGKIYAEVNETEYEANEKDTGVFNNNLASVWGNEDTSYEIDYFEHVEGMKNGEVKLTTIEDGEKEYLTIILRGDITDDANEYLDGLKSEVRHGMKDEDFSTEMDKLIAEITLEEIKSATKPFKVKNIKYPDSY